MIAEKHLRPKTFRLALAPSIVNPRVNKLWLIPISRPRAMWPEFKPIVKDIREAYAAIGASGFPVDIYALNLKAVRAEAGFFLRGGAELEINGTREAVLFGQRQHHRFVNEVCTLLNRCGTAIPNRIRETVSSMVPDTPFAWWMTVLLRYSKMAPQEYDLVVGEPDHRVGKWGFFGPGQKEHGGWKWPDPLGASLSAIEAAGLMPPSPEESTIVVGEWSRLMSKTEFSQRVRQDTKARFRQVESLFNRLEKQQEPGSIKWSFRLDTIDESLRKKLEADWP